MFNLITHEVNNERSDYLYTHFLLETNGSAPFVLFLRFSSQNSVLHEARLLHHII